MNEYDSSRILDLLKKSDYEKTENAENADCYLINTCHIREKATEKVFHDVGRIKKNYRNKKKPIVLIAGCVAQAEGEIILKNDKYIDAVIGPQSYQELPKVLIEFDENTNNLKSINCFSNEENEWRNSIINFIEENKLENKCKEEGLIVP